MFFEAHFKKRPLPWKIHGCASAGSRSFLEFHSRIELLKTLLKIQEFPAQEFLENCCLDLLKVCEIFLIFDSVIFNITAQKNITCQKLTKAKIIFLNGIIWYPLFWLTCIRMNHEFSLSTNMFCLRNMHKLLQWHAWIHVNCFNDELR